MLTQIPQKQKLAMTVKLSLSGREDGDFGGIGMVGHDYGYAGLYYTGEGIQVRCCRGTVTQPMFEGEAVEKVVFSQEAEGAQAWFRLTLEEDKTYGFSYSFDGTELLPDRIFLSSETCHLDRCKTLSVVLLPGKPAV